MGWWGEELEGFRDSGVQGFRIQDSGFRIQDSGFRIQDSGFRIQGLKKPGAISIFLDS